MKVLIIGSRGMLGQELVKVFSDGKNDVIAWDKDECDITNKQEIQGQVSSLKPDILINSAAYNDVDGAEKEANKANLINGLAVGFLAEIAEKLGIAMVYYSTDYVFRGDKKDGYAEEDIPDPQSAYAKSKFLGEQELRNNCSKFYLIRLSRLFGKMGSGEGVKKSFADKLIELSTNPPTPPLSPVGRQGGLRGDPPIPPLSPVGRQGGLRGVRELKLVDEEMSSPTYAPDAAKLTFEIVKNKRPFGIYHGANSGACTWYSFGVEIFKILGDNEIKIIPVKAEEFPRPAVRPRYSVLLNTKLPKQRDWKDALKEYLS